MIYFIYCAAQRAIKIGVADDPAARLQSLQTGCPDRLTLLVVIPGGRPEEAALHGRFKDIRLRGEWFRESPELMEEIDMHRLSLCPVAGTNPEGLPVPDAPVLRELRDQDVICPELCYLTSMAVGHFVSVYKVALTDRPSFQVMRWDERPGPGLAFWKHQLWGRPQWYATAEEACAAYVASHVEWREKGGDP